MSVVKRTAVPASEISVEFNAFYPYVWVKNIDDGTVYASDSPDISDRGRIRTDGVLMIKAGETACIHATDRKIYLYKVEAPSNYVEISAQFISECPFA